MGQSLSSFSDDCRLPMHIVTIIHKLSSMSVFSTSTTRKDVANDEIASATLLSSLTQSSKSSVYRGAKGALHKKHVNPGIQKEKNYLNEFINLCCDGIEETFEALKLR
jgi:serine/threonine protein phosphatase PrpC